MKRWWITHLDVTMNARSSCCLIVQYQEEPPPTGSNDDLPHPPSINPFSSLLMQHRPFLLLDLFLGTRPLPPLKLWSLERPQALPIGSS